MGKPVFIDVVCLCERWEMPGRVVKRCGDVGVWDKDEVKGCVKQKEGRMIADADLRWVWYVETVFPV